MKYNLKNTAPNSNFDNHRKQSCYYTFLYQYKLHIYLVLE